MNSLDKYIDPEYKPEESLILRYHKGISFDNLSKEDFQAVSLKEGARIHKFVNYKGVSIYIADESTLMSGGTFKTLEACLTIALCKNRGYNKIAFSSGSNTGSALTIYGRKAGIETFFFHPKTTSWKLDRSLFQSSPAHLISVDKQEKEVKKAALLFAEMAGIRHVPEFEWRLSATGLRAFFVFEYTLKNEIKFDWVSQAVCAGYGPIGFYNIAKKLIRERIINKKSVPRFLGIQQEALSPMVRAWKNRHNRILPEDIISIPTEFLAPALYNTNPESSYPILYNHLRNFGGDLCLLTKQEYEDYLPLLLKWLSETGIRITKRQISGKDEILEQAGLVGLSGTLKAIDKGIIKKGKRVLSFLTGGDGNYSGKQAIAEYEIKKEDCLEKAIQDYLDILKNTEIKNVECLRR